MLETILEAIKKNPDSFNFKAVLRHKPTNLYAVYGGFVIDIKHAYRLEIAPTPCELETLIFTIDPDLLDKYSPEEFEVVIVS